MLSGHDFLGSTGPNRKPRCEERSFECPDGSPCSPGDVALEDGIMLVGGKPGSVRRMATERCLLQRTQLALRIEYLEARLAVLQQCTNFSDEAAVAENTTLASDAATEPLNDQQALELSALVAELQKIRVASALFDAESGLIGGTLCNAFPARARSTHPSDSTCLASAAPLVEITKPSTGSTALFHQPLVPRGAATEQDGVTESFLRAQIEFLLDLPRISMGTVDVWGNRSFTAADSDWVRQLLGASSTAGVAAEPKPHNKTDA